MDIQTAKKSIIPIKVRLIKRRNKREDGGPGSGNWGHAGRPGSVGGSAEGGGTHNRIEEESSYTSLSQIRRALSKPHYISKEEVLKLRAFSGSILIVDGKRYIMSSTGPKDKETGEKEDPEGIGRLILKNVTNKKYENAKITEEDRKAAEITKESFKEAFNPSKEESFKEYAGKTAELWKTLDQKTKDALYEYTNHDAFILNSRIRFAKASDEDVKGEYENFNERIDLITEAINKSISDRPVVLHRNIEPQFVERMFRLTPGFLTDSEEYGERNYIPKQNLDKLIGRIGTEDSFGSAHSNSQLYYGEGEIDLEILAPAGTKMLYMEPFSKYGGGKGPKWKGELDQEYISVENETLLQRGTSYQIVGHRKTYRYQVLQVAIVSQDYERSEYSQKRKENEKSQI